MYRRFDEYDRSGITGPVEDPPGGGDPLPPRILGQKWLDITWAWDPSASLAQLITGFEVGVAVGTAPGQDPWLVAPFAVPASDRRAVRAVSLASDLTTAHACVRPLYGAQAGPWTVQGVAQSVAAVPVPVATLVQVQAAQAAADEANAAIADIAADGKLTPIEKHQARQEWDVIAAEKVVNDTQATTFGITTEKTAYGTAFQELATYLNAGTTWSSGTPSWLADANLSTTTTIDGATFRANWKAYYDARTALLNAIAAKAKALADAAQGTANSAATAATSAQAAANNAATAASNAGSAAANAQAAANNANAALADIAADGKLTPIEKHQARQEWDVIAAEKVVNDTQATTFGITTEKTTYGTKFQALADYLNNGTAWSSGIPTWIADANLSATTTIVGATFRTKFKEYYDARTALMNAIAAKAKTLADAAQTDVTNILTGATLFGGENLAFNGNMEKSTGSRPKGWTIYNNGSDAGTTLTSGTGGIFGNATALVAFNTATVTMGIRCGLDIDSVGGVQGLWKTNTTYVVTGVVRGSGSAIGNGLFLRWNTTPTNTTWITNPTISSSWQRFVVRITLGATTESSGRLYISIAGMPLAAAGTVEFDGIQVEEGSVPTVWKPCARELIADAAAAQAAANNANAALADIAADGKLTPIEKHQARQEWDVIAAEKVVNDTQATTFGITTEKTAYGTAFQALATYLNAGTTWSSGTPSWLADANLSTTTTIDGATFRANWKAYYDARTALLNAIAAKAKALADAAQGTANSAATAATSAQAAANNAATAASNAGSAAANAQAAANNANAALADIAADGKLTPSEKHSTRLQWDTILGERAGIQSRADAVSVSRTAYDSAFQALATYLNAGTTWSSGTPSWLADANLSTTTPIDGPTFRANWKALFDARQALLNAITAAAQTAANTAQTAANSAQTAANAASTAASYADRLARSGHNLIKNGNSEDPDPTGYEAAGVYDTTNDAYKAYTGSKVRRTVTGGTGSAYFYITGEIPCSPGEQHVIEAMVLNISAVGAVNVGIRYAGPSGATGWGVKGAPGTTNAWTRTDCIGTAPEGTTSVSFYIAHDAAGGAGALAYYDCLYATKKVSAGMLETDILKALLVLGEVIETPNYVPGSAGVPPVGARVAGAPWTITLLDGTTIQGNLEVGEGASIAGHPALSYANMLLYRKAEFVSPGAWSWTVPAGVRRARITVCGAGGGGQGGSSVRGGLGGRNGAALVLELTNLTPGQVISGVNGAAGAAGDAGSYGGDGGASTLTVAGKMWTVNGGAGGGKTTTTVSTLTGGYGTTCTASERKTDLLDGSLLGGLNIQSLRYATGASGAQNAAAFVAVGGYGSWLAPGGKAGDGGTLVIPNGQAGAAGTKGSGGGGGGGAASGGTDGIGGAGGPGYALIEY